MPSFRISLAMSLGLIAMIALGLAGMASASSVWTAAAATVTLAIFLGAILAAFLLEKSRRAFWAGFALFGWAYLVLVNWDWVGGQFGHDLTAGLSDLAEALFPAQAVTAPPAPIPPAGVLPVQPIRVPQAPVGGNALNNPPALTPVPPRSAPTVAALSYYEQVRQRQIKMGNFVQISRMCLSLLFALLGGLIARTLVEGFDTQRRPERSAPPR
jgi:hypothetical protein